MTMYIYYIYGYGYGYGMVNDIPKENPQNVLWIFLWTKFYTNKNLVK
nr:MAG TPA: hypothetical protein [Caudoviricetes sp.]